MVRVRFTDEELNNFKFEKLVKGEFPKAVRQSFKLMWDNTYGPGQIWDDSDAVRSSFLAKEGSTDIPTHKSYKEWDCTALFKATIFAKSFALPDSKGHLKTLSKIYVKPRGLPEERFHTSVVSPVGDNAETFALAIDQLRRLRNYHCHSSSAVMDKKTFDHCVRLAKEAFKVLGVETETIDFVKNLPESQLPTKEVAMLQRENRHMRFVLFA